MNKSKHIAWALSISGSLILCSLLAVMVDKAAITNVAMEAIHSNPKLAEQGMVGGTVAYFAELIVLLIGLGLGSAIFWFPKNRVA